MRRSAMPAISASAMPKVHRKGYRLAVQVPTGERFIFARHIQKQQRIVGSRIDLALTRLAIVANDISDRANDLGRAAQAVSVLHAAARINQRAAGHEAANLR